MSEEEMQQKMEFIINQQAQFTVDIQQLRESQGKLTDAVIGVVGVVGKLAERVDGLVGHVEEIAEAQKRTDTQIAETNAQLSETNERLNIFINVVERYINEGRNGRAPN
jgi:ABC-type transporter Mla subunit MlaD